ncbi:MAG: glycosyltransferase family 39 protein [Acidobacteriota bacterium]
MTSTPATRSEHASCGPRWPLLAAIGYLIVPGHSAVPLAGVPIGLGGAVLVTTLMVMWWCLRDVRWPRVTIVAAAAALMVCAVVKTGVSVGEPDLGWTGRYHVNDTFAGPPERSTDFTRLGATRIDRVLDFDGASFPVYFLNDLRFELPAGRSQLVVEQPLSIAWTAFTGVDAAGPYRVTLTARGMASIAVDGVERLRVASPGEVASSDAIIDPGPGRHRIDVSYVKPANVAGRLAVEGLPMTLTESAEATEAPPATDGILAAVAWPVHFVAALIVLWMLTRPVIVVAGAVTPAESGPRLLPVLVLALFGVQGALASLGHIGRVWDLTTGDDWFGFEARARDLLLNGPLMLLGAPVGAAEPYFYYPLYSYFAAAIHWLVGEDGSGIVFAQFLILAITTIVVHRLAAGMFNRQVAVIAVAALIVIEQAAFVRYYTVTMLADNLYVLPVALAVWSLTRFANQGHLRSLALAGFWVGVAALTKPSMLAFFALALPLVAGLSVGAGAGGAVRRMTLFAGVALLVIGVATARNVIAAREAVLITKGQGPTFIHYALPPAMIAKEGYTAALPSGLVDSAAMLARIAWAHPAEYVSWNVQKLVFSTGFVHLQQGYRAHPELLLAFFGYLASLVLVRAASSRAAWPSHVFIVSHLATMVLTLPWVYGYRLILPVFLFTPVFAAAAADAVWRRWLARLVTRPGEVS